MEAGAKKNKMKWVELLKFRCPYVDRLGQPCEQKYLSFKYPGALLHLTSYIHYDTERYSQYIKEQHIKPE